MEDSAGGGWMKGKEENGGEWRSFSLTTAFLTQGTHSILQTNDRNLKAIRRQTGEGSELSLGQTGG